MQLVFYDCAGKPWSTAFAKIGLHELSDGLHGEVDMYQVNPIEVDIQRAYTGRHCYMRFQLFENVDAVEKVLTPKAGPDFGIVFTNEEEMVYSVDNAAAVRAIESCIREAREAGGLKMWEPVYCKDRDAVFSYWVNRKKDMESEKGVKVYFLERLTDAVREHVDSQRGGQWTGFDARYETAGLLIEFGMGSVNLALGKADGSGTISEFPSS